MISQRETVAVEALRTIAERDPEGSGRYAVEVLKQIEEIGESAGTTTHNLQAMDVVVDKVGGGLDGK